MLEQFVLNTKTIKDSVEELGIVTLQADWTKKDEKTGKVLEQLGGRQLPVLAIFSAKNPNRPIVLRGAYTKAQLLEKLKEAGPSKAVAKKKAELEDERNAYRPPWRPFSADRLETELAQGRIVLVSFVVDWSTQSQIIEHHVLNSRTVRDFIEQHDIVALQANATKMNDEIEQVLVEAGRTLPLVAIYSPHTRSGPSVLRVFFTEEELLAKLEASVKES